MDFWEKALKIVKGRSDKNPVETRKQRYLKAFPNAVLKNGTPTVCAGAVFGFYCEYKSGPVVDCKSCWSQEYVEE